MIEMGSIRLTLLTMRGIEGKANWQQVYRVREDQIAILPGWLKLPLKGCQALKVLQCAGMAQEPRAAPPQERYLILVLITERS